MTIKKNRMNKKQPEESTAPRFVEMLMLIIAIVMFIFVGEKAGMRFLGVMMLVFACHTLLVRRVPYGLEGQKPMGYLTGVPAIISGLLSLLLAGLMIFRPAMVLDFFAS